MFEKIVRTITGVALTIWLARHLGPEKFGLYSYATAFVALLGSAAGLGLHGIVVRQLVNEPEKRGQILGTSGVLMTLSGAFSFSTILGLTLLFQTDDTRDFVLIAIIGATFLFKGSEIAIYWFEYQVLSKYIVWAQSIILIFFTLFKMLIIYAFNSLIHLSFLIFLEALILAITLLIILFYRGFGLKKLTFSCSQAKYLLGQSWPLLLSTISILVYLKVDQIMIGQIIDRYNVGIYSSAVRVSEAIYFLPVIVMSSIFPAIAKLKNENPEKFRMTFQKTFDLMVLLSFLVIAVFYFFSSFVIKTLYGPSYFEAILVLKIHILAVIFVFLGVASGKWFLVENLQIFLLRRALLGAVLNIVLNLVLIPSHGIHGAAIATVLSYASADFLSDLLSAKTRPLFLMKIRAFYLINSVKRLS